VQLQRPYRQAWHAALEEILEQPRDIQIWSQLRENTVGPKPKVSGRQY
jgi:quinol monooxygenase YgiN